MNAHITRESMIVRAQSLTHEDLILLAALLGNHFNGDMDNPVARVAEKLLAYVERTEPQRHESLIQPLPLAVSTEHPYGSRAMLRWEERAPKGWDKVEV